jgi:TonB family protein
MHRRSDLVLVLLGVVTVIVLALWPTVRAQPAKSAAALNTSAFAQPNAGAQGTTSVDNARREWAILTPTQGVDFGPYMDQLLKRVRHTWFDSMPEEAMAGDKGKVSVVFAILPDGTLSAEGPALQVSSHHKPLDQAALLAIRNSAPFNPLPGAFHGTSLKLRLSLLYNTR